MRTEKTLLTAPTPLNDKLDDFRGLALQGDWLYVARFGPGRASTWTGELAMVHRMTGEVRTVHPGLNHPVELFFAGASLFVAVTGDTAETTSTGQILRLQ